VLHYGVFNQISLQRGNFLKYSRLSDTIASKALVGLGVLVVLVFAGLVVYLANVPGCSKLEMGLPNWFQGSFEHCAEAAGEATRQVVLNAGGSEEAASAAGTAAKSAALTAFNRGESSNEVREAAANAAALEVQRITGSETEEATGAGAAAAAAARAALSSGSPEEGVMAGNEVLEEYQDQSNVDTSQDMQDTSPSATPQDIQDTSRDMQDTSPSATHQDIQDTSPQVNPPPSQDDSNDTG
jgi:hypothetical protein